MIKPKYDYPRVSLTVTLSSGAYDLLREMCGELNISHQDAIASALLSRIDPAKQTEDWKHLSINLFI